MRERFRLSVSVFVIVRSGDQVLLLRRAHTGWQDGGFSLPAGAHDGAETLAAAAARELKEETSLLVDEADLKLVHLLHCRSGDSGAEWLGAFFAAERWRGEPRLVEHGKHDQIGWHRIDALPDATIAYTRQAIDLSQRGVAYSSHGWPAPPETITPARTAHDQTLHEPGRGRVRRP